MGPALAGSKVLVLVQAGTAFAAAGATYVGFSLALRLPEFRETLALAIGALRRERPSA
jgi:hypothetical protein